MSKYICKECESCNTEMSKTKGVKLFCKKEKMFGEDRFITGLGEDGGYPYNTSPKWCPKNK